MDLNQLRSLVTLFSFLLFAGLAAWAWWPGRRSDYEAAARLPFDGEAGEGPRAERLAVPEPAHARRETRRAFVPSRSAQVDREPRHSVPSGDRQMNSFDEGHQ